ncbi:MAG: hypothetical protein GY705_10105 [Bacteroidetes bacterium]|nr:hypothetical protein [Bacteroidota bacterium]
MESKDILKWIKRNIKPIHDSIYGNRYRCAAILNDGLYLPCVVISSSKAKVDLAFSRFDETRNDKKLHKSVGYRSIVESFVTGGNNLNHYDIKELFLSNFDIPLSRLAEINGETAMGWTEFYATMEDGKEFCFGTTFNIEFFSMPEGYKASSIVKIIPAVRGMPRKFKQVYRERPFFECYIENL